MLAAEVPSIAVKEPEEGLAIPERPAFRCSGLEKGMTKGLLKFFTFPWGPRSRRRIPSTTNSCLDRTIRELEVLGKETQDPEQEMEGNSEASVCS